MKGIQFRLHTMDIHYTNGVNHSGWDCKISEHMELDFWFPFSIFLLKWFTK